MQSLPCAASQQCFPITRRFKDKLADNPNSCSNTSLSTFKSYIISDVDFYAESPLISQTEMYMSDIWSSPEQQTRLVWAFLVSSI